jgi:phytol kinase
MDLFGALPGLLSPQNWLYYAPVSIAVLASTALLAGWLKLKKGVKVNYTRKVFHILNFTYAAGAFLFGGTVAVLFFGGRGMGAMLLVMLLPDGNILLEGIAREQDIPHRRFYIIVPFAATAVAGLVDSALIPQFAVVGYLVSGWGDAAGEPVGTRWGRHRYKVKALWGVACTRSVEGSMGVFAASWAAAFVGLQIARVAWLPAIPISLAAAGAAALVEAVSSHGLDNLTVQMAAAFTAYGLVLAVGIA